MSWILSSALTGVAAFIATNIDDLVILMLFFAQVNSNFRRRDIYVGQYLGFVAIVLLSLPGFLGGLLVSKPLIGLLGLIPIALGIRSLVQSEDDEIQAVTLSDNLKQKSWINCVVSPQVLSVAAITVANGGDNIGIYVSLFASQTFAGLGVILSTFFACVGIWCLVADQLSKHRAIAPVLTRYSHVLVPIVLISLGICLLAENQSWLLIPSFLS